MAKPPLYTLTIKGLSDAEQLPDEIERVRREFPRRAGEALADELRGRLARDPHAPHGERIAVHVEGGAVKLETLGSKKARALEYGATILADKGRSTKTGRPPTLKFVVDGHTLYRRRVVIQRNRPGGKPFARALRGRRAVVQGVWNEMSGEVHGG